MKNHNMHCAVRNINVISKTLEIVVASCVMSGHIQTLYLFVSARMTNLQKDHSDSTPVVDICIVNVFTLLYSGIMPESQSR